MKKHSRILSLLLVVSMLFGFTGCTSLVKLPKTTEKDTKISSTESGKKDSITSDKSAKQSEQETVEEEPLMSELFTGKLELLEYLIELYYMNEVSTKELQTGAYKGLLEGLGDPYSCYYTAEEYHDLLESSTGVYCGIGAVVQQNVKTMLITIVKPYVNGPAYKAGMLPGDVIYMVDDVDVTGMDINSVVAMMKGEEGSIVKVTVVRDGVTEPVELTITRDVIEVETIEHEMLEDKIGLISISEFDEVTIQQFKDAVEELEKDGMKGLIIDLRDNPGGLLNAVVDMLDYILPKGLIVYTEDKYGNKEEYAGNDNHEVTLPIVVMINENSASASEIFAAAIQDYEAGTIVGMTSFGKGIVQSIIPLSDGTAVKLTVSRYFTPKGVCIHEIGVVPDVEVDLAEELKQKVVIEHEEDNQLAEAIQVLMKQIQ